MASMSSRRNLRDPLRLQLATQPIGRNACDTGNTRPLRLRDDVSRQRMAADANDILGLPNTRLTM